MGFPAHLPNQFGSLCIAGGIQLEARAVGWDNCEQLRFRARGTVPNFPIPVTIDVEQRVCWIHIALSGVVAFRIDQAPRPASG